MSSKEERVSVIQTQQPDVAAVKGRQRQTWASGDYSAVAARIVPMAVPTPVGGFVGGVPIMIGSCR